MRRLHANLLLLTTALIWGVTFVFQKMAMDDIGPLYFTGLRFLLGAAVLVPLVVMEWRQKARMAAKPLSWGSWVGVLVTGTVLFLAATLQQIGVTGTSVANAGFLTALYVPITPVLVYVVWRKWPHPALWPAVVACLGGAYLMAGGNLDSLRSGDLWVAAGALFWATHILLVSQMIKRIGAPFLISFGQFFVCGLLGVLFGLALETLSVEMVWHALPLLTVSGVVSVGVAFTIQVMAQRYTPPADASILLSAETVFAALAGLVLLGERLGALEIVGGGLILGGVLAVEIVPLLISRRLNSRDPAVS